MYLIDKIIIKIDYIDNKPRRLCCEAGSDMFVIDPVGDIYPCNVLDDTLGNIKKTPFDEIWHGEKATQIREKVKHCSENCWMIGSVVAPMHKQIWKPVWWIFKQKYLSNGR